jgi:pentatricopeptide repeat protein
MGEKHGYTLKTYNILAVALMLKNDFERALKVFESAVAEMKLETADGEARYLY